MPMRIEVDLDPELKALGAPTFDEFRKNRDKYLTDDVLARADAGSTLLRPKRHIYEIEGHRTRKLEEVERIAGDYGIPIRELDYRPEIVPQAGHDYDILVKLVPKHIRDKRNEW